MEGGCHIIGIESVHFTPKNSDKKIAGIKVHVGIPMPPKKGQGEEVDSFFLSDAKLAALDFVPAVGQTVEVLYNKYGKVSTLRLLAPLDDDIEIG